VNKRKVIPVAIALVAVIAVSGVAYAYWTAGGSGSGTGNVANPASDLTVTGAPLANDMYPGAAAETTSVTIKNNATASVHVTTVSISSVTTSDETHCKGADNFTRGLPVTIASASQNIAGSASVTAPGPTIQFFNDSVNNQDACKGVVVTVHYSVS
jgi:hypothetical protein